VVIGSSTTKSATGIHKKMGVAVLIKLYSQTQVELTSPTMQLPAPAPAIENKDSPYYLLLVLDFQAETMKN
jgi:cytochrome b561